MEIIAYCNNSCCPSIIIEDGQPLTIKDDYEGAIALSISEFKKVTAWITKHISDPTIALHYATPEFVLPEITVKIYRKDGGRFISIERGESKVIDITFDHWKVFVEAVEAHAVVV